MENSYSNIPQQLSNSSAIVNQSYTPLDVTIPQTGLVPTGFVQYTSTSSGQHQDVSVIAAVVTQASITGAPVQSLLLPASSIVPNQPSIAVSSAMQLINRHSTLGPHKGVIYAFSQYSPLIGMSHAPHVQISQVNSENDGSNLGPEDVAEVRKMATAAAETFGHQDQFPQRDSGKCQAGGELRLSELSEKLDSFVVPDGFCLVGAKSPMLQGMVLVVLVDKRFLPGDPNTITMLGFTGSCIGCGATGFRYFTEFSSHINLKLATQPKKQKHLKYYITKNQEGKWTRGLFIPWKGTETRKRSVPGSYNMPLFGRTPAVLPLRKVTVARETKAPIIMTTLIDEEPIEKKPKIDLVGEMTCSSGEMTSLHRNEIDQKQESHVPNVENDADLAFKMPLSSLCGVQPVLLLCQQNSFKLPTNINDIIISDLLVGSFDFPDNLSHSVVDTATTYKLAHSSIMSTGVTNVVVANPHSNVEQNAAKTLLDMGETSFNQVDSKTKPNENKTGALLKKSCMSLPAAIIVMTQYLCSLDDLSINKDQIEIMLKKAKLEINSSVNPMLSQLSSPFINGNQLSLILNLQCCASNGRVKTITSTTSFQNSLFKALRWLHDTFYMSSLSKKKPLIPSFIVILSTPYSGLLEFGVLVIGVSQAKIIAETLGVSRIVRTPFHDLFSRLQKQFSQATNALKTLLCMFNEARDNMVYIPFNGYAGMRLPLSQAKEYQPSIAPISVRPTHTKGIFANQSAMAQQLLKQVRNISENPEILDLATFMKVQIVIVVPPVVSLYYLSVKRLCESGLLNFLGLETEETIERYDIGEKYVITYSDWPESVKKWNSFVDNTQLNRDSLFLLIFDQAQRYCLPQGMPDVLPNLKKVFECSNVIPVFVTSVPYMFQTRKSFIDPDNEVYWTDATQLSANSKFADETCIMINDKDMVYFGIKEFCDSIRWNQQYPLIRHDETFEVASIKANRINDINYSTVHGFALMRLYQAAMMVGGGIKPAEPYTITSIIRMVNDIIESPLRNVDGSGSMMMVRIPNVQMAKQFYDVLLETRNSLGFQCRFDILLDDGEHALNIGDYFLERMRRWKQVRGWDEEEVSTWKPKCLEELLDLPCFLILSGEKRGGETFPRSLKYVDYNILNHSAFHRSTIEAEIGAVSCYLSINAGTQSEISTKPVVMNNVRTSIGTTYLPASLEAPGHDPKACCDKDKCLGCLGKDRDRPHSDTSIHFSSKYPLPILLVSKPLWVLLNSHGNMPGLINLNSDPNIRWIQNNRPMLTTLKPDRMSRYYRRWTDARNAGSILTTPSSSSPTSPKGGCDEERRDSRLFTVAKGYQSISQKDQSGDHVDHDDKDNEDADKEQYHPRCLLLSGPPQAGKTGAYLHFAHLLHRMLLRLKRVDVVDNCITYQTSISAEQSESPTYNTIMSTKFVSSFLDTSLLGLSTVHVCTKDDEVHKQVVSVDREQTSSALVILAKSSAYDVYHHCDMCKFYREGIDNTTTREYEYTLRDSEMGAIELKIYVPPIHAKYFQVDENSVPCLILAKNEGSSGASIVKTPIFMWSTGGDESGLLNLFHAMVESDHVHITFIKSEELEKYQKNWPNHMFITLPSEFNCASEGAVKNIIKEFATQNYFQAQTSTSEEVWPYIMLVPDHIVMWHKYGTEVPESDSDDDVHEPADKPRGPDAMMAPLRSTSSLLDVINGIESQSSLLSIGMASIRPWSSMQDEAVVPPYLRTFVHSIIFLNVQLTRDVSFATDLYVAEDIDFQLRLMDKGIYCVRFEHFCFMSKLKMSAYWRGNDVLPVDMSKLVVAPDIEDSFALPSNSHVVLQKYLSNCGCNLFPLAVNTPKHPVLVIGGYLDLGSKISVCVATFMESGALKLCSENRTFSGLVVYIRKELTKEDLSRFRFLKDAQLLFVCKERMQLRTEALRLDLEDSWRIRLRDEYQTATQSDQLYFFTGTYIV